MYHCTKCNWTGNHHAVRWEPADDTCNAMCPCCNNEYCRMMDDIDIMRMQCVVTYRSQLAQLAIAQTAYTRAFRTDRRAQLSLFEPIWDRTRGLRPGRIVAVINSLSNN